MKPQNKRYPLAVAAVFLWVGFVCAISFMEAWLKFRAPGITIPLGLGIGRLVFHALNRVEIILSFTILASMIFVGIEGFKWKYVLYIIPFLILVMQSIWLLPLLDDRAGLIIQGENVPAAHYHIVYIGSELVKVMSLTLFGIKLLHHKD